MTKQSAQLTMRMTTLLRDKLAGDAGPYGSLSMVARMILERHYGLKPKTPRRPL
jgi:hypothetical protein